MTSWYEYQKLFFDFDFPSLRFCRLKTWNFTSGHVKNRAKGDLGIVRVVTSYQERSQCQNKLRGPHCGDPIHFIFLYSATAKLSTKLCETADVTSNLGSDLAILGQVVELLPSGRNVIAIVMVRLWRAQLTKLGFALPEFCTLDAVPFELTHRAWVLTWCAWKLSLAFVAFRAESAYAVVLCFLIQVPKSNRCIQVFSHAFSNASELYM